MPTIGIYKLVSSLSGKFYIGSSTNIEVRYRRHLQDLANKKHYNYKIIKEYNLGATFSLEVIDVCSKDELPDKELGYILFYDCVDTGLNISYDTRRNYSVLE